MTQYEKLDEIIPQPAEQPRNGTIRRVGGAAAVGVVVATGVATLASPGTAEASPASSNVEHAGRVAYYSQLDLPTDTHMYGPLKMGYTGCGPTSEAMVISTLAQRTVTPIQMADWNTARGLLDSGGATEHDALVRGPEAYGLRANYISKNLASIKSVTDQGGLVEINGTDYDPATPATKGGHIFVIREVTSDGMIEIANPDSRSDTNREFTPSQILDPASMAVGVYAPKNYVPYGEATPPPERKPAPNPQPPESKPHPVHHPSAPEKPKPPVTDPSIPTGPIGSTENSPPSTGSTIPSGPIGSPEGQAPTAPSIPAGPIASSGNQPPSTGLGSGSGEVKPPAGGIPEGPISSLNHGETSTPPVTTAPEQPQPQPKPQPPTTVPELPKPAGSSILDSIPAGPLAVLPESGITTEISQVSSTLPDPTKPSPPTTRGLTLPESPLGIALSSIGGSTSTVEKPKTEPTHTKAPAPKPSKPAPRPQPQPQPPVVREVDIHHINAFGPKNGEIIDPTMVVEHDWGYGKDAPPDINILKNELTGEGLSVQYGITTDGKMYQLTTRPNDMAWQAKCANPYSIGIEIQGGTNQVNGKEVQAAALLTRHLMQEYNIPLNETYKNGQGYGVWSHKDIDPYCGSEANGKVDVSAHNLAQIKQAIVDLQHPPAPPPEETHPAPAPKRPAPPHHQTAAHVENASSSHPNTAASPDSIIPNGPLGSFTSEVSTSDATSVTGPAGVGGTTNPNTSGTDSSIPSGPMSNIPTGPESSAGIPSGPENAASLPGPTTSGNSIPSGPEALPATTTDNIPGGPMGVLATAQHVETTVANGPLGIFLPPKTHSPAPEHPHTAPAPQHPHHAAPAKPHHAAAPPHHKSVEKKHEDPVWALPSYIPYPYKQAFINAGKMENVSPALIAAIFTEENFTGEEQWQTKSSWEQLPRVHSNPDSGWPTNGFDTLGPMQFIPETWDAEATDGNHDGHKDPQNIWDASASTAHYLGSNGATLDKPYEDWHGAIWDYNHADWYVNKVLGYAGHYHADALHGK